VTDTPSKSTSNSNSKNAKTTKTTTTQTATLGSARPVADGPRPANSPPDLTPPDRTTRALLRRLPRYEQIALDLRARIESGELAPGAPIPSETQMGAQYGVSRITVRHAVASLRAAGLVVTEHGRATRVRPTLHTAASPNLDLASGRLEFDPAVTRHRNTHHRDDAVSGDGGYRTWDSEGWADVETPARYRITAGRHAAPLGLKPDEPVFVYERQLLHTSGVQVMHRVLVPAATAVSTGLEDPFQPPADLFTALTNAGHELHWHESTQAEMPTPDEAATLEIPDGVPLLVHTRVTLTPADTGATPLTLEETRLPADRTTITHAHAVPADEF
jgi:GntR family transcriptional regulator